VTGILALLLTLGKQLCIAGGEVLLLLCTTLLEGNTGE
jgi:hypothetical protein